MKNKYSFYHPVLCSIFLLCLGIGGATSCTDDTFSENGDVDSQMAVLKIQMPKVGDAGGDQEITSAQFIAFASGGGGTSGALQLNKKITGTTDRLLMPMGQSNIYIIANAPDSLKLAGIRTEKELTDKFASWKLSSNTPYIMVGDYRNVSIGKDGAVKDEQGAATVIGNNLQRMASKLIVNLKFVPSAGKGKMVVDSLKVAYRPVAARLLAESYSGDAWVSPAVDKKNPKEAQNVAGVIEYAPVEFYLSEYLVDKDHIGKTTRLHIYAHAEGSTDVEEFEVYIGDWFGTGMSYDDFKQQGVTPGNVAGAEGLSVTRNKRYTLNCTLNAVGKPTVDVTVETTVEEWKIVEVEGDIKAPFLYLASQDIMVNPVARTGQGTQIAYQSSSKPTVTITDNPDKRFTAIVKDNVIIFEASPSVNRVTREENGQYLPITGKASIVVGGITKTVTLGIFNPLSKYYVRGANADYSTYPATGSVVNMTWKQAAGYRDSYSGVGNPALTGVDANVTKMNDALPDAATGCAGYWEGAPDDPYTGRGNWRLPRFESNPQAEGWRTFQLMLALDTDAERMEKIQSNVYHWGSLEHSEAQAWTLNTWGGGLWRNYAKAKSYPVRCIRDLDHKHAGTDASYLNISHNNYEVAEISYRTLWGIVPIKFESDYPVSVRLLDEDGVDISDEKDRHLPFIGFFSNSEDGLFSADSEPEIAFPNWRWDDSGNDFVPVVLPTPIQKGYFCLHSAIASNNTFKTSVGNTIGETPVNIRKRKYSLLFKAGSISKIVKVVVVSTIMPDEFPYLTPESSATFPTAMSVSYYYTGYDYLTKQYVNEDGPGSVMKTTKLSLPVPDNFNRGCAAYFQGNSGDPKTGKGNWFLSQSFPYLYNLATRHFMKDRGEELIQSKFYNRWKEDVQINYSTHPYGYWTTTPYHDPKYQMTIAVAFGVGFEPLSKLFNLSNEVAIDQEAPMRCERRLNADRLDLSTQTVQFSTTGGNNEVLYYTDADNINTKIMRTGGSGIPFTCSVQSNKLVITCPAGTPSGTSANLLIGTEGKSKYAATYKIIKLSVK